MDMIMLAGPLVGGGVEVEEEVFLAKAAMVVSFQPLGEGAVVPLLAHQKGCGGSSSV